MKKANWVIHYILGDYELKGLVNIHTHGMERYDHLDFQLVLPLGKQEAASLLNTICIEVQNGRRFQPGCYSGEIYTCDFRLELHRETGRDVLRLIFPDEKMRFPEHPRCDRPYIFQNIKPREK